MTRTRLVLLTIWLTLWAMNGAGPADGGTGGRRARRGRRHGPGATAGRPVVLAASHRAGAGRGGPRGSSSRIGSRPTGSMAMPASGTATTSPPGPASSSRSTPRRGLARPRSTTSGSPRRSRRRSARRSPPTGSRSSSSRSTHAKAVRFKVGETVWKCDLATYECVQAPAGDAPAEAAGELPTPGSRTRGAGRPGGNGNGRSPDGKWTAVIKDHDVYLRAEGTSEPVRLSSDGKEGLRPTAGSPGRPTRRPWSPSASSRAITRTST